MISDLAQPDDGPLSEEELEAREEADAAIVVGGVRPLCEALRALGI